MVETPRGIETRASTETFTAEDPVVRDVIRFFRDNLANAFRKEVHCTPTEYREHDRQQASPS